MSARLLIKKLLKPVVPPSVADWYREYRFQQSLSGLAKDIHMRDAAGLPQEDPGAETAIAATLAWLCRAQDLSKTSDGGVAGHFSLVDGWSASYPETTGYIVPTILAEAVRANSDSLHQRACRMLDWLVSIQFAEGGFQGGLVTETPSVPVTFNTGQILIGLAIASRKIADHRYLEAMHKAARWLIETQDSDGAWRRHPTPFAARGEKSYETHVAWGLFEAERTAPDQGYGAAGLKQTRWALAKQRANGWFEDCCLSNAQIPLTHTIGYALRGVLEAYRMSQEDVFLHAALKTGESLLRCLDATGGLPGRLDDGWRPAADWVCLTGNVQIALCWFLLYEWTRDSRFLEAGKRANGFVRRTLILDENPDVTGGVRGSFPVSGHYGRYELLNWAAKFLIDSNRAELELSA